MEKEKQTRILIIALCCVAIVLLIVLAWLWLDRNQMMGGLNQEKEELTQQMEQLKTDYDGLAVRMGSGAEFGKISNKGFSSKVDSLNSQLSREREKVKELLQKIKSTDAKNTKLIRKYEKELEELREIARGYIIQIDSLNRLNQALRQEVEEVRGQARESQQKYKNLQTTTDEYAKQVQIGSVVKGRDFGLEAITASGKVTDRSSRAAKLKTSVSLMDNTLASKGQRKVFVRVKSPDGILMTGSQQQIFTCDGEKMIYSAVKEVDYQGVEIPMSIYFANSQSFEKGTYTVDIYTEEGKLGSASVSLK